MLKAPRLYRRLLMSLCIVITQKCIIAQSGPRGKAPLQQISYDSCHVRLDDVMRALAPSVLYMLSDNVGNLRRDVHISNMNLNEALTHLEKRYSVRFVYRNGQYLIRAYRLQISGYTYDDEGNTLPGVNITNLETGEAHTSNGRGYFCLWVPDGSYIGFSYSGKKPKVFAIQQDTLLHVSLPDSSRLLEGVVVEPNYCLGHTWIPKKTASGAFRSLDMAAVQQHPGYDLVTKLACETGVPVQFADVLRGKRLMALRGNSTLYGDRYAFMVLDGLPQPWNNAHFESFDIASITLAKDAASSALWGARAGNGTVVMNTQQGAYKKGLQCSFLHRIAFGEKPDIHYQAGPDAVSFLNWEKDMFNGLASKTASGYSILQDLLYKRFNNQIGEDDLNAGLAFLQQQDIRRDIAARLHQASLCQQYAVSFSNGAPYFRYYASIGTELQRSNEKGNSQQHHHALFNTSFRDNNRFEINVSTYLSELQSRQNALHLPSLQPYLSFSNSAGQPAWIPYKYPMNKIAPQPGNRFYDWHYYPEQETGLTDDRTQDLLLQQSVQLNYAFTRWLKANLVYKYAFTRYNRTVTHAAESFFSRDLVNRFHQPPASGNEWPIPYGSIGDEQLITGQTKDYRAQLEANYAWGPFRFEGIAGTEQHRQDMRIHAERTYGEDEGVNQSRIETAQPFLTNPYGTSDYIPSGYAKWDSTNLFRGFYFYGTLTYLDKLSISASVRREQSNRFAQNTNRTALPMYSIGASWQINDVFRWRADYGRTGITDYNSLPFTSISPSTASYPLYTIVSPANEQLQSEYQYMLTTGIDFVLKKHLLSGGVDVFSRRSTHVLMQQDGNTVSGYARILDNSGRVRGHGAELYLETAPLTIAPSLYWKGRLSYSYARNVLQSAQGRNWPAWSYSNAASWTPKPGDPIDPVYVYPSETLDPTDGSPRGFLQGQVSKNYAALLADTSAGALLCAGSGTPLSYGSLRQTLQYKGFYLTAVFTYKGNYVMRKPALSYYSMFNLQNSGTPDFDRRWQHPGDELDTRVPSSLSLPDKLQDAFYENSSDNIIRADHVRCQYLQIGFSCCNTDKHFPAFLKCIHGADISLSLYNAGIVWRANRNHLDPDVAADGWPAARSYLFSIKVNW